MSAASKLDGDALAAQMTPLATPASARRRAGIVVCSQARDHEDSIELLDMLGLRTAPAPATAPPPPTRRRTATIITTPAAASAVVDPAAECADSAETPVSPDQHRPRAATTPATPATPPAAAVPARKRPALASARWTDSKVAAANGVVIDCSATGAPAVGICQGDNCGRPMVSVRAYRKDACWRQNGFVYHSARGLCNRCYNAWYSSQHQATSVGSAGSVQDTVANDGLGGGPDNSAVTGTSAEFDGLAEPSEEAGRTPVEATVDAVPAVVVAALYPVLCTECGIVGDTTPNTPTAAETLREQHIADHQQRAHQPDVPQPRPAHRSESALLAVVGGAR